jgi:hypothetical protein
MNIDSPIQSVMHNGRVSCPSGKWWIAPTTNTNTPMPNFNNLVMDRDEMVLKTSPNILDKKEPKFY